MDVLTFSHEYPVIVTGLVVAAGWVVSRRAQLAAERTKHSVSHEHILAREDFKHNRRLIGEYLNSSRTYDPGLKLKFVDDALWECLQHMEKTSIDIDLGYLSEHYHYKISKTFNNRLFITSHKLITKIRETRNAPSLFSSYEALFIRQFFRANSLLHRLTEVVYGGPILGLSSSYFGLFIKGVHPILAAIIGPFSPRQLPMKITYLENIHETKNRFHAWIADVILMECLFLMIIVKLVLL